MRTTALLVGLATALVARADPAPPAPAPLPDGIADARGELGFFRAPRAGVIAVELATGKVRWSSLEGEWPLHAGLETVAVVAVDGAGAFRVRFLRLRDGRRVAESEPVALPDGLSIPDPRKVPGRATATFTLSGWVLPAAREAPEREGPLRVRWEWSYTPVYGFRPPAPEETRRASGAVVVDPASGRVTPADDRERPAIARAELPATFRAEPGLLYWSFSEHGAGWSVAPTPLLLGGGVQGAFACEPRGERRLTLLRWRSREPLETVEIARGGEYAPLVALGGRFVALSEQRPGNEHVLVLHDLAPDATSPPVALPAFAQHCRPPFAVVGAHLLCLRERDGESIQGGTAFGREIVAIRTRTGERAWSVAVAPRLLPAPVPGAR